MAHMSTPLGAARLGRGTKILSRLPRAHAASMAVDAAVVVAMYYLMLNFRYFQVEPNWRPWTAGLASFAVVAVVVHLVSNWLAGVYGMVSRYMSLNQAIRVGQAGIVAVSVLLIGVIVWPLLSGEANYPIPRSVVVAGGLAATVVSIGLRFSRRTLHERQSRKSSSCAERVLLVGAGQAADMIIREIARTPALGLQVVGLVDDRRDLRNMTMQGLPVLGTVAEIPALAQAHGVTQIIVAIPSASAEQIAHIYRLSKPAGVPVKILPSLADLVSGTISLRDARDLDIKDLLGRPKIDTDMAAICDYLQGSTVLVTGAAGSIGSELCRQIARFDPGRLVLVDHDESSLFDLQQQLRGLGFHRYAVCPTNILQERKLNKIFALYRPKLVVHAAAYKHVPLMELNPDEAVLNNVQGTWLVAEAAARYGAERFVDISTDKAVEPCNVMGATKRAGELVVRMLSKRNPDTRFAVVRFGNVLGSQGSVVPLFKSQIETGGPVIITHPDMTRYFMLIEEAVQLVLQAALMVDDSHGDGETSLNTFVLEMGHPVEIVELAQRMIDFYWKDQAKSIGVEFSGLRPGEKLEETLVYSYEKVERTEHPLITRVTSTSGAPKHNGHSDHFETEVRGLIRLAAQHGDARDIIEALAATVADYQPMPSSIGAVPARRLAAV
jgi:FlaA1/EpsC-like NDP-sugar epimerase